MLYKEGPVLKNIACSDLRDGEATYLLLQPYYTLQALFGRLRMLIKQS